MHGRFSIGEKKECGLLWRPKVRIRKYFCKAPVLANRALRNFLHAKSILLIESCQFFYEASGSTSFFLGIVHIVCVNSADDGVYQNVDVPMQIIANPFYQLKI